MKAIRAYIKGWQYAFRKFKMWLLLYLLNVLLAILCTFPLIKLLDEKLGRSVVLEDILPDFDYAVYNDVIHQFGKAISVVLDQSWTTISLYFLLSIFTMGGILRTLQKAEEAFSFQRFWAAGAYYFWRIFRLTIYFMAVQGLLFSMVAGLLWSFLEGGPGTFENEDYVNRIVAIIAPIYFFFVFLIAMIHDYAKIHVVESDRYFLFRPIWQSVGMVFRRFTATFGLYLLNFITFVLVAIAYWIFNANGKIADAATVVTATVVGQAFIFFRIGSKLFNLGSATYLYQQWMRSAPSSPPVIEQESLAVDLPEDASPTA